MARLLSWPRGLAITAYQRMTGPRSVGGASTESITSFVQTVSSPFGAWRYQISLRGLKGSLARQYRGMVSALNGGANAVRVPFNDPDVMSWQDAGINIDKFDPRRGVAWSNNQPFSNGCNWGMTRPMVAVVADAAIGDTIITLEDRYWGAHLLGGEWLGFMPFCFGKYDVTEVIGGGQYRIWPPLRAVLTAGQSFANLNPVMAMRLEGESAASDKRGTTYADGNALTLLEVRDDDARAYFADQSAPDIGINQLSLREDGGNALREDGGSELRE